MKYNPKRLFLIDSLGACLTAFLLSAILASWEEIFGMPPTTLYLLSGVAGVFALYSFGCYLFFPANWRPFLKTIAIANLMYCCLTAGYIIHFYPRLTVWGVAYFWGEIAVVIGLVMLEMKTVKETVS